MTEHQLIRRLQQGDLSALDIIYALYAESALRTAYLITYSRHDAEDIVHAAFVQVIRSIKTLRDPGAFRGWFYRIVVNSAYKHCKRTTRFQQLIEPDELLSPTDLQEEALRSIESTQILEAIDSLDDIYRIPLILKYYSGLSEKEIAGTLDIPQGTVKSRLNMARSKLDPLIKREVTAHG